MELAPWSFAWSLQTDMPMGPLRSVEIENSDAPLLLSLEAQKQLGLILDLRREVASLRRWTVTSASS